MLYRVSLTGKHDRFSVPQLGYLGYHSNSFPCGVTRVLIGWYVRGQKSESVIDRIKYFYMVLDTEAKRTSQKTHPYNPPQECKLLRDAVSHTRAGNPNVVSYLKQEIQSTVIDPTNESHIQFLERKAPLIQHEAQRILNLKLPQWW